MLEDTTHTLLLYNHINWINIGHRVRDHSLHRAVGGENMCHMGVCVFDMLSKEKRCCVLQKTNKHVLKI